MRTVLLSLSVLSLACGASHVYRPAAPLDRGGDEAVSFQAKELVESADGRLELVLDARSQVNAQVGGARLAPADAAPCTGGVTASQAAPERGGLIKVGQSALTPASNRLTLVFAEEGLGSNRVLGAAPTVADVTVRAEGDTAPRCVRTPVVPRAAPVEWHEDPRYWVGGGMRLVSLRSQPHDIGSALLGSARAGVQIGPARVGGELTFGFPRVVGSLSRATGGGGTVEAPLWIHRGDKISSGFLGEVGYEFLDLERWDSPSDTKGSFHGPRASLRYGFMPTKRPWPGFDSRNGSAGIWVEATGARWWSSGAAPTWVTGVGMGMFGAF